MQLLIENTLTAHSQLVELANKSYRIGRGNECDIVLASPFVSRMQAMIEYARPSFIIQPLGMNGTFVNEKELQRKDQIALKAGDRIRIGEYVISVSPGEQDGKADQQRLNLAKKFVDLETRVHTELLQRLDLRKMMNSRQNDQKKWSEEHLRTVHRHLTDIVNQQEFIAGPDVEEHVVRETMKTLVMDSVAFRGQSDPAGSRQPGEEQVGQYEEQIADITDHLLRDLELSQDSDPERVQENTKKVEEDFGAAMDRQWPAISGGLRRYIVKRRIRKDIHDMIVGLGPLQDLLNYPNVTEIMVVSRDQIYVEKNGKIEDSGRAFVSDEIGMSIIERIVSPLGRRIDKAQPLVDARLADGSRVNAIIPPLALAGPCITIRKFARKPFTIDDLIEKRTLDRRAANFLRACVKGKKNIIISGGTGSGKTTLLNVLSAFIEERERIITIEDSAELQLQQKHVVRLETKPANIEGTGAFTIRDLVRNSLRMRPDRIIVGECRGAEALDMLQAMNTGHSGSMTTGHANTPSDILLRLETMVLEAEAMPVSAIRAQVAAALDVIVQQARLDGKRRVTHITEVVELDEQEGRIILEDIFVYRRPTDGSDGELLYTGYIPTFLPELLTEKTADKKPLLKLEDMFNPEAI